jgi:hypothetical protein
MNDTRPALTLDDLYWHTDLPVGEIAERLDLPARGLHRHVTPLDAGVTCYRCHRALTYSSRSDRDSWRLRCGHCGTTRANPRSRSARPSIDRPAAVGGTILVRDGRDIGLSIDDCIGALATAGLAWDQQSLIVLGGRAGDGHDAVEALRAATPGTLAVASLCDLAATQTERLQALFLLTSLRWRVVAAHDVYGHRRSDTSRYLDELDEPLEPHDPWAPTGAEHLVEMTMDGAWVRRPW